MNPWIETIIVIISLLLGGAIGLFLSHLKGPWWLLGYFLSFLFIILLIVGRFCPAIAFNKYFCFVFMARLKFALLAPAITMGIMSLFTKLKSNFQRVGLVIIMFLVVTWFGVMPFLSPALIQKDLLKLPTILNADGICMQSTDYTCAPASAVTALRKLGFRATEGQLAVLAHTSPVAGTLPLCLANAINRSYNDDGLSCEYLHFDSIDQLKNKPLTLAVIKDSFLSDHCVVILKVTNTRVEIADPSIGRIFMSHKGFKKVWRYSGIVINRTAPVLAKTPESDSSI